ncbi:hypothetical protein [Methanosarcina sp. UBA5]|nr:hypothetical protein [Methanosarcina sp. UBA5]
MRKWREAGGDEFWGAGKYKFSAIIEDYKKSKLDLILNIYKLI